MRMLPSGFEDRVLYEQDRLWLAERAVRVGADAGFDKETLGRIALCVSELVTNAVRHAGGGVLRVRVVQPAPVVLAIEMEDEGPGIAMPELAVRDGYSKGRFIAPDDPRDTLRGLGTGLGALVRLSSSFSCEQREGGGTRIELRFGPSRSRFTR